MHAFTFQASDNRYVTKVYSNSYTPKPVRIQRCPSFVMCRLAVKPV